jgi:hypothetical protein
MATVYTNRLILVVRQAFADKANVASKLVDTVGGERTFTVPLRLAGDATNTIRAYWAGWTLTPAQAAALRTRLQEQGLLDGEVVVVTKADQATFVPNLQARAYIFDARPGAWAPQEALAVLNLDTLAVTVP